MHILKGNHRNVQGLLERATLMVEPANGGFRDAETGEVYKARKYKVADYTAIEIIGERTNTEVVYTAFLPDAGECERIGMPVAQANVVDRDSVADELLRGVPNESRADHEVIAAAIRRGESREHILAMPEVDRWPETYSWLTGELQ